MTDQPESLADGQWDALFAGLDTRAVADAALDLAEHLAHVLNDAEASDRIRALRRRLDAGQPAAKFGRGKCPRCLRTYALNGDGSVRAHSTASGRPCRDREAR